ncbi:cation:proton antiporter [Chryseobacterium salivictor]|uniref:Na(+)/H(+)-K(+) antiporter GerN n=1 Tax=Chryseobacterium salivictor TaxID=2547600 RepID=A0A4P6ZE21_9FLAO|nr:cation:proton antiporter [Chryseobacterium salivictor]QBO57642.1 Na(+)/H(+)-K(+) antiporter GerN [Chryseobacterium salivictor]
MLTLLKVSQFDLPLEDPVLKFLVVLIIILSAPLLLNKIKVPHLLGLIIAGAVVGPNGFNILTRDSSIVVTGTTGLLYIMFLAGLEIDLAEFKKNKYKSMGFGAYTFIIPFIIGIAAAHFIMDYNWLTSFLFASIFSSHTLISYPLVSKLGVVKNRAVNVTVGGTVITDILALLVLAIVVGMTTGEVNAAFWTKLSVGIIIFALIVLIGFPIIGRWFFKKVSDKISQYIFVLVMIYFAALLAELAGIEAIIGAFLAGLALNKLIPHSSSLMNRVEFVGNAIFIPFFLISVGMLIDVTVFFKDLETIKVALLMITISIGGKYLASIATQKTFSFTKPEGGIIFGLSSASAAATLATVTVGYNIIIGETYLGEPIRLLDESVLNGSILLILISCTISSFVTQKHAEELVKADNENTISDNNPERENILLAVNHLNTVDPMTNLALLIKSKKTAENLFVLNIINEEKNDSSKKNAETLLNKTVEIGASADVKITPITRYDTDVIDGTNNVIKEYSVTDLMIGIDAEKGFSPGFIYNLYSGYLNNNATNILIYHARQPASTIQKYVVILPENATREPHFFHALLKVWNLARNSGSKIEFYGNDATIAMLEKIKKKVNIDASFIIFNDWNELPKLFDKMKDDDALILFMAHRTMVSYQPQMQLVPDYLNTYFRQRNFLLIFPAHEDEIEYRKDTRDIANADDFVEIGKIVGKLFK